MVRVLTDGELREIIALFINEVYWDFFEGVREEAIKQDSSDSDIIFQFFIYLETKWLGLYKGIDIDAEEKRLLAMVPTVYNEMQQIISLIEDFCAEHSDRYTFRRDFPGHMRGDCVAIELLNAGASSYLMLELSDYLHRKGINDVATDVVSVIQETFQDKPFVCFEYLS